MTLILLVVTLSGMGGTVVLMHLGVHRMWLRYGLAVLFSYLIFLAAIRLWLWYVFARNARSSSNNSLDAGDLPGLSIPADLGDGGDDAGGIAETVGQGGSSGGGGASASWAPSSSLSSTNPVAATVSSSTSSSTSGGSGIGSFFDGIDGDAAIFILIGILVAALSGVWIYLIYQAPVILSEIAFHFLLASGLMRRARSASIEGWALSTIKGTWIPLAIILGLSIALGAVAQSVYPEATGLGPIIKNWMAE